MCLLLLPFRLFSDELKQNAVKTILLKRENMTTPFDQFRHLVRISGTVLPGFKSCNNSQPYL